MGGLLDKATAANEDAQDAVLVGEPTVAAKQDNSAGLLQAAQSQAPRVVSEGDQKKATAFNIAGAVTTLVGGVLALQGGYISFLIMLAVLGVALGLFYLSQSMK